MYNRFDIMSANVTTDTETGARALASQPSVRGAARGSAVLATRRCDLAVCPAEAAVLNQSALFPSSLRPDCRLVSCAPRRSFFPSFSFMNDFNGTSVPACASEVVAWEGQPCQPPSATSEPSWAATVHELPAAASMTARTSLRGRSRAPDSLRRGQDAHQLDPPKP